MKRNIKVRFNLAKGKHYMMWKVEGPFGINYYSPSSIQLVLKGCKLKNSRKTAQKIFEGDYKSVCAWILCEDINIIRSDFKQYDVMNTVKLKYNPKDNPFWTLGNTAQNIDGNEYTEIFSVDYGLYVENKFGGLNK